MTLEVEHPPNYVPSEPIKVAFLRVSFVIKHSTNGPQSGALQTMRQKSDH